MQPSALVRRAHPKRSLDFRSCRLRVGCDVPERCKQRRLTRVERLTSFGDAHATVGSLQQPDAELVLKPVHGCADRGFRQPCPVASGRGAARLHDPAEIFPVAPVAWRRQRLPPSCSVDLALPHRKNAAPNGDPRHKIEAIQRAEEARLLRDHAPISCSARLAASLLVWSMLSKAWLIRSRMAW